MASHSDMSAFHNLLRRITANGRKPRILAVCGAGLSAASGLPTFRGSTAALWHTHNPMALATPEAFEADPGLVWRFYAYRRHMALKAKPNAGHFALAALARVLSDGSSPSSHFLCLTQNVDGLSPLARHPPESLRTLHGSLFDIKCVSCDYVKRDYFADPINAALAFDDAAEDATASGHPSTPAHIPAADLPQCPQCAADGKTSLLRPGVVWFGECLDDTVLYEVDQWLMGPPEQQPSYWHIDLVMVIGTTAEVQPSASYIEDAREMGAMMAVVNLDADTPARQAQMQLGLGDFAFAGRAEELLPVMLEPLIGKLGAEGQGGGGAEERGTAGAAVTRA